MYGVAVGILILALIIGVAIIYAILSLIVGWVVIHVLGMLGIGPGHAPLSVYLFVGFPIVLLAMAFREAVRRDGEG